MFDSDTKNRRQLQGFQSRNDGEYSLTIIIRNEGASDIPRRQLLEHYRKILNLFGASQIVEDFTIKESARNLLISTAQRKYKIIVGYPLVQQF